MAFGVAVGLVVGVAGFVIMHRVRSEPLQAATISPQPAREAPTDLVMIAPSPAKLDPLGILPPKPRQDTQPSWEPPEVAAQRGTSHGVKLEEALPATFPSVHTPDGGAGGAALPPPKKGDATDKRNWELLRVAFGQRTLKASDVRKALGSSQRKLGNLGNELWIYADGGQVLFHGDEVKAVYPPQ